VGDDGDQLAHPASCKRQTMEQMKRECQNMPCKHPAVRKPGQNWIVLAEHFREEPIFTGFFS